MPGAHPPGGGLSRLPAPAPAAPRWAARRRHGPRRRQRPPGAAARRRQGRQEGRCAPLRDTPRRPAAAPGAAPGAALCEARRRRLAEDTGGGGAGRRRAGAAGLRGAAADEVWLALRGAGAAPPLPRCPSPPSPAAPRGRRRPCCVIVAPPCPRERGRELGLGALPPQRGCPPDPEGGRVGQGSPPRAGGCPSGFPAGARPGPEPGKPPQGVGGVVSRPCRDSRAVARRDPRAPADENWGVLKAQRSSLGG